MTIDHTAYADACVAIDQAAFDAAKWSEAIDLLALATSSRAGELVGVDPQSSVPLHTVTDANLDVASMLVRWHEVGGATPRINPMIRAGLASPSMRPLLEHELISRDERTRHILWNEVFDPYDIPHLGSIVVHKNGPEHLVVSLLRGKHQGPVEGEALKRLIDFAGRVKSSAALSRSLGLEAAKLVTSALEAVNVAAIALSSWGQVVGVTEAAERLLATTQCLRVDRWRVEATNHKSDQRIQEAIAAAKLGKSGEVTIAHAPGRQLKILAHPLAGSLHLGFSARVLLTFEEGPAIEHLTAAEKVVLSLLAEGISIGAIADIRGVSKETVKSQSKSIYSKLGVAGQMDVVGLFGLNK